MAKKEALVMQFVIITIEKLPSSPATSKCSDTHTQSILVGIHPHTLTADGLAAAGAGRHSWGRETPNGHISCVAGTTVHVCGSPIKAIATMSVTYLLELPLNSYFLQ